MIDLTPLEVRQKKGDFRRAMRGYEPALVDDFLDLVAERLEDLVRENRTMHDELVRLREQLTEFKERERALTEALVTAQEMREELRRQAEKDADLVRREAKRRARKPSRCCPSRSSRHRWRRRSKIPRWTGSRRCCERKPKGRTRPCASPGHL